MTDAVELLVRSVIIGAGGALLMDAWALVARRAFNVQGLDYAMLGRWIGHIPRGRLVHERISAAQPIRGERPLGWAAHYAIGIGFAGLLLGIWGLDWARSPSVWPPIVVGFATIGGPWLVMQPGMGLGIAASKAQRPGATRFRNLVTHAVYGLGLYLTAAGLAVVW